jgi:hypothetical protein
MALWFDGPPSRPVAGTLAVIYSLTSLGTLVVIQRKGHAFAACFVLFALLFGWWLSLDPSNSRNWERDVAQLPTATVLDDKITIRNVRNFVYRSETDYDERWETRHYDLAKLQALDLFMVYWGSPLIAHTILSWEFSNGQHLAISIETRKQKGENYSAVRGFFRQYELYYVVADERDVIKLRSNYRREEVYLYRLRTPPSRARLILLDYLKSINQLAREPQWYNALKYNCTTTIRLHATNVVNEIPHDWRWVVNGYLDEMLYKQSILNNDMSFAMLKSLSYINSKAQNANNANFSQLIRKGVPPRPVPPFD